VRQAPEYQERKEKPSHLIFASAALIPRWRSPEPIPIRCIFSRLVMSMKFHPKDRDLLYLKKW
jgi:hypothetical protein